ncbi:hypothetical protein D3C71_688160 [compost metagenome]
MKGGRIPEDQRIEPAGNEGNDGENDDDERQGREHLGGRCTAERTERPEGDVAQRPVIRHENHQPGQRAADCRHRNAGQNERGGGGRAVLGGDQVKHPGVQQSAEECHDGQEMRAEKHRHRGKRAFPKGNRRDRKQRRTRGDADNAGIGQWIAEQALHHRP